MEEGDPKDLVATSKDLVAQRIAYIERMKAKHPETVDVRFANAKPDGNGPRNRHGMPKLPVGQREVKNWPVLDLGDIPKIPLETWKLEVGGLVENPFTLSWKEFQALQQVEDASDFHCVTTWSRYDIEFKGVAFFTIVDLVKPKTSATHVFFKSYDGYSTNNPLTTCLDDDVLIAHTADGKALTIEHGGPARVIIPKRYAWKGAKFIREIVFLDRDILGFWEVRGYSNDADPWLEQRFAQYDSRKLP